MARPQGWILFCACSALVVLGLALGSTRAQEVRPPVGELETGGRYQLVDFEFSEARLERSVVFDRRTGTVHRLSARQGQPGAYDRWSYDAPTAEVGRTRVTVQEK